MNFDGAEQFGIWVLIALALLPSIKTIIGWARGSHTEIHPQPLSVRASTESPTESECELKHEEVNRRIKALEDSTENIRNSFTSALTVSEGHHSDRTESLRRELKQDIEGVHSRIGVVLQAVSRVEGSLRKTGEDS